MSVPALQMPVFRASDKTVKVNVSDDLPNDHPTRSLRVGHLVRGDHTLCGRSTTAFAWIDPDDTTVRCGSCFSVPAGYVISRDLLDIPGLTYRQIDWWCRRGWLRPLMARTGSGFQRTFPPEEFRVASLMAVLTGAGLTPAGAERVARGEQLAPGVWVVSASEPVAEIAGQAS